MNAHKNGSILTFLGVNIKSITFILNIICMKFDDNFAFCPTFIDDYLYSNVYIWIIYVESLSCLFEITIYVLLSSKFEFHTFHIVIKKKTSDSCSRLEKCWTICLSVCFEFNVRLVYLTLLSDIKNILSLSNSTLGLNLNLNSTFQQIFNSVILYIHLRM